MRSVHTCSHVKDCDWVSGTGSCALASELWKAVVVGDSSLDRLSTGSSRCIRQIIARWVLAGVAGTAHVWIQCQGRGPAEWLRCALSLACPPRLGALPASTGLRCNGCTRAVTNTCSGFRGVRSASTQHLLPNATALPAHHCPVHVIHTVRAPCRACRCQVRGAQCAGRQ